MNENEIIKIDEEWTQDDVKTYVQTWNTYEEEIKTLRESRNEWSKSFLEEKKIPKKELKQAMKIVKEGQDINVVQNMTETIESLMGYEE